MLHYNYNYYTLLLTTKAGHSINEIIFPFLHLLLQISSYSVSIASSGSDTSWRSSIPLFRYIQCMFECDLGT